MTEHITRGDPSDMSHSALKNEWQEVAERLNTPTSDSEIHDRLWNRRTELWQEMKSRTDADPPECPGCGGSRWGQSPGEPKVCMECDLHLGSPRQDLIERIDEYWRAVKSPDGDTDE